VTRRARLLALLLPLALTGCAGSANRGPATEPVAILTLAQGDIVLRFFPDTAPEHVKNFLWHVENTYAGCTFHRVIPGFMIQGGDPNSKDDDPVNDGQGGYSYRGPGTTLAPEFSARRHRRGTLSMARAADPASAGSQFFIMHGDAPQLDGKYSVFGEVIDGIEVVDAVVNVRRDDRDRPVVDQRILAARVEEWPTAKVEAVKEEMVAGDPAAPRF
jgi:peptidyl-prolyl cis-trans isomerase B (cyclophilin B)